MQQQQSNRTLIMLASMTLLVVKIDSIVGQSCHSRELDLCAAPLVVFTQSPSGLALNNHDLDKQCNYIKEADVCLSNFTRRCMTPIQSSMISILTEGSRQVLKDYCTPNSYIREQFLKHSSCLNEALKTHHKSCIKDLQASLEVMTQSMSTSETKQWQKRVPVGCCAYRRFENCIGGQVERKCGKEAQDFVKLVLKRVLSRMPDMMCRNYKPEGSTCKSILPAVGTIPKACISIKLMS
ncbi:hypothetical protein GZH46_01890, partial [Fragariocoptes setiger]